MFRRRCVVINLKGALIIVFMFMMMGVRQSQTASNLMDNNTKDHSKSVSISNEAMDLNAVKILNSTNTLCTDEEIGPCSILKFPCIRCNYNYNCLYGQESNITCTVLDHIQCTGERSFQRTMKCRYCYQTDNWEQSCIQRGNCNAGNSEYYRTNCTVHSYVYCLGNRSFTKNVKCNWTQGYRWSTALLISFTLGGFGADRFYLGHWQEGIGKLFSFGGLGVWTIIDVLLISLHYLGPADGSLYI